VLRNASNTLADATISSAIAEIACDADDVDFSVDDVHSALTLAFNFSYTTSY